MPNLGRMTGTPWHVERITRQEGDPRRHKSRCIYLNKDDSYCAMYNHGCYGSAHCDAYKEKEKEKNTPNSTANNAMNQGEDKKEEDNADTAPVSSDEDKILYLNRIFSVGTRIMHSKYGKGTVHSISGRRVEIEFDEDPSIIKLFDPFCYYDKIMIPIKNEEEYVVNTLIYKTHFDVESVDGCNSKDLLSKITLKIRDWLIRKYNKRTPRIDEDITKWEQFVLGNRMQDQYGSVVCESVYNYSENVIIWSGKIEETVIEKGFAPRIFVSELGFVSKSASVASISYCVSYHESPLYFGKTQYPIPPSIPSVIRSIIEDNTLVCSVGRTRIQPSAILLSKNPQEELESIVFDRDRSMPVVFVQPSLEAPSKAALLAEKISRNVFGNANVYYSNQYLAANGASDIWNGGYQCGQGSVRVYMEHVDPDIPNDAKRHRFFTKQELEEDDGKNVCRILNRVFCRDPSDKDALINYKDYINLIEIKSTHRKLNAIETEYENLQRTYNEDVRLLRSNLESVKEENETLKNENACLYDSLDSMQDKKKRKNIFNWLFRK